MCESKAALAVFADELAGADDAALPRSLAPGVDKALVGDRRRGRRVCPRWRPGNRHPHKPMWIAHLDVVVLVDSSPLARGQPSKVDG